MAEGVNLKAGIDVLAERERQRHHHAWSIAHDDEHTDGSLAAVAALYATPVRLFQKEELDDLGAAFKDPWPESWSPDYDKRPLDPHGYWHLDNENAEPKFRRRLLVKSGALIIAEIERLDRLYPVTIGEEDA